LPTEREPVTAFFRSELYDASHDALTRRLRIEEPRVRVTYPHEQTFERKNVVIIIVDSLRADHMQIYGYGRPTTPFLKSLLESGKLRKVELATSTCSETKCGIISMLSSKNLHGIVREDFKLHDVLHDLGYQTYFILSSDHNWYGLKQAYGNDLTYYFDGADSKLYPSTMDDRLIFEGLRKVPEFEGIPSFFYFHLMSVHFAGVKQEQYRFYQPAAVVRDWNTLIRGNYDVLSLVNNYDNGIVQADAVIRQIFESLQRKGYLANALVIILADHGEGLGDRGEKDFGHLNSLHQEFIRIPLLIYDDSPTAYANLTYATQIDVAPTVLARLGLLIPPSWQGQSLLGPDQNRYTFHQTRLFTPAYAILFRAQGVTYKYLYRSQDRKEELYELNSDPDEKNNLVSSADPSLIDRMRTKLAEYVAQH
jgi:glucan phosphoethanolaminetransferase (alkaline phosphatase superfamily)